ncbi:hypothetical protein D3C75_386980 [compost metagenome]
MSNSKLLVIFKRLFKTKRIQKNSSVVREPLAALPKEQQTSWMQMKARWEAERQASSAEIVLNDLLRQRHESMESIESLLEEALSLLDDATTEAPESLKSEIKAIWTALDELVQKTFTESN